MVISELELVALPNQLLMLPFGMKTLGHKTIERLRMEVSFLVV